MVKSEGIRVSRIITVCFISALSVIGRSTLWLESIYLSFIE